MKHDWEVRPLGDVLELEYGKALDASDRSPQGKYPAYGANGPKARTNKYLVDEVSIIVGRKGSAGEITLSEQRFWPLDVTYYVDFDRSSHNVRFLYYLLRHLNLPSLAKGVKPGINRHDVYALEAPIPTLSEQDRIVRILDRALSHLDAANAATRSAMTMTDTLHPGRLWEVFDHYSGEWPREALGSITEVQSGGTPSVAEGDYWGGDIPWFSSGELGPESVGDSQRRITPIGLARSNAKVFPSGSLLIGMYDTAALKMSVLASSAAFNQAIAGIKPSPRLDTYFAMLAITFMKPEILAQRRGVRQKNLSLQKIKAIQVPLPQLDVQRAIVKEFLDLGSRVNSLRRVQNRRLELHKELRSSLLHQAFSGHL